MTYPDKLKAAFVAGFLATGEGYNGEYVGSMHANPREKAEEEFEEWYEDQFDVTMECPACGHPEVDVGPFESECAECGLSFAGGYLDDEMTY